MKKSRLSALLVALSLSSLAVSSLALALQVPAGEPRVVEMLSGISYSPTRNAIDEVFGLSAVDDLIAIASDRSANADPGLRLRALRGLGLYAGTAKQATARTWLQGAVQEYSSASQGSDLLFLRASMISLATIDGANALPKLLTLLSHPSRDIRAACARALGITRLAAAILPLRDQALIEVEEQVQVAIADALFAIETAQH